ncbi:MerR family transcriptional regulator [Euzebya sp.]|uniref:MerR family transcriptional regulator n=1 Tax=Euzebya sp. TaxID=1971409 RepID=UPI003512B46E
MRTVSELAQMAGVTVRTLHHYDEIGLLRPSQRSEAGYRLYDRADLQRLQQILFWRALGFSLSEIQDVLDDPDYDRVEALTSQRAMLARQLEDVTAMVKAVDDAIAEARGGPEVDELEMFETFNSDEYRAEAEARWGDTDAWRQSQDRVGRMSDAQKRDLVREGEAFVRHLAETFQRGVAPDSVEAMDLAEEARLAIDRQFYDCSREMHVNLGEMYVADPRFTAYYDRHAPGLAVWLRDAIVANAAR